VLQRRRTPAQRSAAAVAHARLSTALGLARTATSLYSRWPVRPAQPFPGPIRRAAPVDPHARPCACRTRRWDRPGPTPSTGYDVPAPLPHPSPIRREQHRKSETTTEVFTRFTWRPRPIPDDGSTRCMTKSCAGTSCGVRGSGCAAMTARGASTGSLRMPLRSTG
jgi:hypothetical protein